MPQERERVYAGRHRIQEKPAKSQPIRTEMELDGGEASDVQFRMFTGTFGQHVIRATHPLIVVADETVLGSFSTLEAAEEFIARQDSSSTVILRHHGQKWVPAEDRPAVLIPQNFTSGAVRENGFHALRPPEATLISRIQEALQKFPHLTYLAGTHFLEVPAQTRNGFRVWIRERAGRDTVGFEKWHEEFTNAASAFNFFM